MKTLAQAYQDFNLEQLIADQLVGTPHALNAYTECCGRHVGSNKVALIWEEKMESLSNGHLINSLNNLAS